MIDTSSFPCRLYYDSLLLFFNDTATTEIYTLSLHDALPICRRATRMLSAFCSATERSRLSSSSGVMMKTAGCARLRDRKSTRLNSSHVEISYAVFCLKKKKVEKICTHMLVQQFTYSIIGHSR